MTYESCERIVRAAYPEAEAWLICWWNTQRAAADRAPLTPDDFWTAYTRTAADMGAALEPGLVVESLDADARVRMLSAAMCEMDALLGCVPGFPFDAVLAKVTGMSVVAPAASVN